MSRANRYGFVFLCCVLAIPTCVYGLGLLRADEPGGAARGRAARRGARRARRSSDRDEAAGLVTLGLSGFAIDVGLIYGCAHFLSGFSVPKCSTPRSRRCS